jgi:hypothetical protein
MFNTVIDQVKAVRGETEVVVVKLGTVTALSGGKAQVKLYGDGSTSTKLYQYIDGYIPEVNDKVALLPQGKTYIILGKITDAAPVEKYATKDYVDETFLPLEYKNKLEDGNNSLTLSGTNLLPGSNNSIDLGASGKQFNKAYAKEFYINGTKLDISGIEISKLTAKSGNYTRTLTMTASSSGATILPSVNNAFTLGSASYMFSEIFAAKFTGDLNGKILDGSYNLAWDASHNLIPSTTNYLSLGTSSKQYKNVYGQNLYVNGTAVTSDKSLKKDIKELEEKHLAFFRCLRPVQFKYKDGESGRTHTGFIAQEVEDAIHEAGMTNQDMAVVVIDQESGRHYLRYEELIAVQTEVIQNMQKKVDSLEARLAKLEALLERSTK